jgi:hypothetical protein
VANPYAATAPADHFTTAAGQVDVVTFPADSQFAEVENRGADDLWFTADGITQPAVAGHGSYHVGPGDALRVDASLRSQPTPNSTVVMVTSASVVAYSVTVS